VPSEQKMRQRVHVHPLQRQLHKEIQLTASETTKCARAEALFKKQEQMSEGAKAMAEYYAAQQAIREKTARLRALRLFARCCPYRPVLTPRTWRASPQ
jgi:hypothetical protein